MFWNGLQLDLFNDVNCGSVLTVVQEVLELPLESIESSDDTCDVVHCSPESSCSQNPIDAVSAVPVRLVQVYLLDLVLGSLHEYLLPGNVDAVLARQFVKDPIAANHNEVMIVFYFECCHIWVSHHHVWIAFKPLDFGLNIAQSP